MIDLRSDTFTLPSPAIRARIAHAEVGDDYYGEDGSALRIERHCCELFGKEAAVFCTSGMLANQLAIASQTTPGNELVTEYNYHVNLYESAQHAAFGNVVLNAHTTTDGVLRAEDVTRIIESKPREAAYAQVQLVSIENTIGSRQGKIFPLAEIGSLRTLTASLGIRLHLDGARLFNAHVATGTPLAAYARHVDTVSVCFSKGLGAPFGSMLLGDRQTIERARRLRVWHGSGFHQIGFYADAAYFALTTQLDQLHEDHRLTMLLAQMLSNVSELGIDPRAVETNMIFLDMTRLGIEPARFVDACRERGVLVLPFPPRFVRIVVCRNVDERGVRRAGEVLTQVVANRTQVS
jgi:threonine aldolase